MLVSLVSLLGALALVTIGPQRLWAAAECCRRRWRRWSGKWTRPRATDTRPLATGPDTENGRKEATRRH